MERAVKGEVVLLFLDASHFVMGCDFLGCIYGRVRRFIRTWSERKRYNVPGAMDFITKKVHTVTNDNYITATEICEMLRKLRPPYSPNLNLIERLWKLVNGELRTKYYDEFGIFCEKIDSVIDSTTRTNKVKVDRRKSTAV